MGRMDLFDDILCLFLVSTRAISTVVENNLVRVILDENDEESPVPEEPKHEALPDALWMDLDREDGNKGCPS